MLRVQLRQSDERRLHDGVSPGAARWVRQLLERAASELGVTIPYPALVGHALLGLWMRVGLFSLFDDTVPRGELAELLTRLSLGAIGGVAVPGGPSESSAEPVPARRAGRPTTRSHS